MASLPRNLGTVDLVSGELLQGVFAFSPSKAKKPHVHALDEPHLIMFQSGLKAVATDKHFKWQDVRVLLYLIGVIGFENEWRKLNQSEVAGVLGMRRFHVNRSVQKLVNAGIVVMGTRIGSGHVYRMNPYFGYKGKLISIDDARRAHDKRVNNAAS
jgi:hypothetical protein